MPSRRDLIRMSDDEVRSFLRSNKTMTINSNGPGGYPHPMPMWFEIDEDHTVQMTTFRKSQKVRNIERDPKVSLLVEAGEKYEELRGVVIYGRARLVDDLAVVTRILLAIGGLRDLTDAAARKNAEAAVSKTAAKRIAILIRPEKIVSWDHRKLGGTY